MQHKTKFALTVYFCTRSVTHKKLYPAKYRVLSKKQDRKLNSELNRIRKGLTHSTFYAPSCCFKTAREWFTNTFYK